MDVEKTIQFILNEQAKTEVMRQQNEERWKKSDERFDKKMAAINKLMVTGMKMIARHDEQIQMLISQQAQTDLVVRELGEAHKELAQAQKKTERTLERFIDNFNRPGSNGKKNGRNRG